MAKAQSRYVCQTCGEAFLRWEGQCRACGSLEQPRRDPRPRAVARGRPAARPGVIDAAGAAAPSAPSPRRDVPRLPTGIGELDRVLGGGLVPGSLVLVGGEPRDRQVDTAAPGRGRRRPARRSGAGPLRDRRGVGRAGPAAGRRASGCSTAPPASAVGSSPRTTSGGSSRSPAQRRPALVVVDSIQTATVDELDGPAGQRRPGPRGDRSGSWSSRRARGSRSSSSATSRRTGRSPARRPSSTSWTRCSPSRGSGTPRCGSSGPPRTASARPRRSASSRWAGAGSSRSPTRRGRSSPTTPEPAPGSVVAPTLEGSRPLLVEVQALVAPAGYGTPARKASGVDPNRLALLVAVLGRRAGVGLGQPRRLRQPCRRPDASASPASTCRSPWRWRRRCATGRSRPGPSRSARSGLLGELRGRDRARAPPARGRPARVRARRRAARQPRRRGARRPSSALRGGRGRRPCATPSRPALGRPARPRGERRPGDARLTRPFGLPAARGRRDIRRGRR